MKNEDTKYFHFPIYMFRGFFINRWKTMELIISAGIYDYSKYILENVDNIEETEIRVCNSIIYDYYNRQRNFTDLLKEKIRAYENDIPFYANQTGFNRHGKFDPAKERESLLKIIYNDSEFYKEAFDYYAVKEANLKLGLKGKNNTGKILTEGREIWSNPLAKGKPVTAMVNKDLAFEYRDGNKDEFQLMQFSAYIAVTSILGKDGICKKTNYGMVLARIFGYNNFRDLSNRDKSTEYIDSLIKKYSHKYWMGKIKDQLELSWYIRSYGHKTKGFYVAHTHKISLEKMIEQIEDKRKSNRDAELKKKKKEIRLRVTENIKLRTQNSTITAQTAARSHPEYIQSTAP